MRVFRKSLNYTLFLALIAAFLLAAQAEARKTETGFLDRTVTVAGTEYKYQVFVPENWTSKKKWPVILFLHGAGERGDDGLIQTQVGIGKVIREDRSGVPAIVVMPQCRKNVWWAESTMGDVAIAALAQAQKEFHGDSTRIYLTGLSMGGYGTWYLAGKYPEKFAAIVPICGGILMPDLSRQQSADDSKPYAEAGGKIGKNTPVWIFHGGDDPIVPVAESQRIAAAMKALGGEVRYSEYPGVGHNSWDKAYAEAEFFPWLLSKVTSPHGNK